MIIGGSIDLAGSNIQKLKTINQLEKIILRKLYSLRVREHAMCGIMNGLSLHSKLIPYGGTF